MREGNEEEKTADDGKRSEELEKCERSVEQFRECGKGRTMESRNKMYSKLPDNNLPYY